MKFKVFWLCIGLSICVSSCKTIDAQSDSKGLINLRAPAHRSKNLTICWNWSTPTEQQCSRHLQEHLIEQYVKRTELDLNFMDRCDLSKGDIHVRWQDQYNEVFHSLNQTADGVSDSEVFLVCQDYSRVDWDFIKTKCNQTEAHANRCLRNIGLHEFGHAFGLIHEDYRPESCRRGIVTPSPDEEIAVITPYDEKSIMNFCYYADMIPTHDLTLSDLDVVALNRLYNKDLTYPEEKCGQGYVYLREKNACILKPRNK